MAQKSGFFNALLIDSEYDRKYNANDYSDNLAVVISNGVLRSNGDDLKCTVSGMTVTTGVGRAWINGHYYMNDSAYSFSPIVPPISGSRYDRIVLRLDNTAAGRKISLEYVKGAAAASPAPPALTRDADIYEIGLCSIHSVAGESAISITDTRADADVCGWVYSTSGDDSFFKSLDSTFGDWFTEKKDTLSSVTLFKRFTWTTTLQTAGSAVAFNIPQYDAETCFIEVYVNGILDTGFTINGNVITFDGYLVAGTDIIVNCYKSIDGTGIMSVAGEITELQNQVATIIGVNKFAYICTGLNDNIALSEIAQAIYAGEYEEGTLTDAAEEFLQRIGGNNYLAQLPEEAQVEIEVVGKLGATTPAAGSGTAESRYRWFSFGVAGSREKKVVFNFAKCQKITIECRGYTSNIIFYGTDLYINNANVYAYANGISSNISMIAGSANSGRMELNDCRFSVSTPGNAYISENGTFTNCFSVVKSQAGNAMCYNAKSASLIRIIGGTHYAYKFGSGGGSKTAAIMNIDSTETAAVIMATNINCPTVAMTGFSQQYLANRAAGNIYISGVCSTMTSQGTVDIQGQIWKSKQ